MQRVYRLYPHLHGYGCFLHYFVKAHALGFRFNLTMATDVPDNIVEAMSYAYIEVIGMLVAITVIIAFSSCFKKFVDFKGESRITLTVAAECYALARREELQMLQTVVAERRAQLEEEVQRRAENNANEVAAVRVDKRRHIH